MDDAAPTRFAGRLRFPGPVATGRTRFLVAVWAASTAAVVAALLFTDLLARYGGDELVWVTAGAEHAPDLEGLMGRVRAELEQPFVARRTPVQLGVSVGYAVFPQDGRNIAALFQVADEAMYRDKRRDAASAGNCPANAPSGPHPVPPTAHVIDGKDA